MELTRDSPRHTNKSMNKQNEMINLHRSYHYDMGYLFHFGKYVRIMKSHGSYHACSMTKLKRKAAACVAFWCERI